MTSKLKNNLFWNATGTNPSTCESITRTTTDLGAPQDNKNKCKGYMFKGLWEPGREPQGETRVGVRH